MVHFATGIDAAVVMMCSDFVLNFVMVSCLSVADAEVEYKLGLMVDVQCVSNGDGWESNEQFADGVVEVVIADVVGIHTSHVHAQCLNALSLLKIDRNQIEQRFTRELFLYLPKYSFVAAAAKAISSSKLFGLQLVVFQCVRRPEALIYFLSQP